jgi:hypothetical protein
VAGLVVVLQPPEARADDAGRTSNQGSRSQPTALTVGYTSIRHDTAERPRYRWVIVAGVTLTNTREHSRDAWGGQLRAVLPVLLAAILFIVMTVFVGSHGSTAAAVLVAADGMLVTGYIAARVWAKTHPR